MFDLVTALWICIGVAYSVLFVVDNRMLSKKKAKAAKAE
jgi:hypothetical protein